MSIERFPMRHASCVWVLRDDNDGWLVLSGDHGWSHGSFAAALTDASWVSENRAMPIRIREAAP